MKLPPPLDYRCIIFYNTCDFVLQTVYWIYACLKCQMGVIWLFTGVMLNKLQARETKASCKHIHRGTLARTGKWKVEEGKDSLETPYPCGADTEE